MKTSMFKAITMIALTAAVLTLGACASKEKSCTMTKVSTTHAK